MPSTTRFPTETKNATLQSEALRMLVSQQMWSYLEPLFIHSEEVKKELPLDTKRFQKIDGEVKAMLTELWAVKKVKSTLVQTALFTHFAAVLFSPHRKVVVRRMKCVVSLNRKLVV